jgi:predicted membrane protein
MVRPPACREVGLSRPAPEHLAFYPGIGVMAVVGIMGWPVVVAVAIGHALVNAQHNKTLHSLGEALEEA